VLVDEETLASAVDNLLSNAVKFTKTGDIELSASSRQRKNVLEIAVKDSGVGIQKEKLGKIFDDFKRLRQTKAKGTGLGLSIVKKAVNRLGGEITVESKEGKGSNFRMVFPLRKVGEMYMVGSGSIGVSRQAKSKKEAAAIRKQSRQTSIPTLAKRPILIIDDDKNTHTALKFILEDQGYSVQFALNGSTGLEIARRKKPGLILMDLTMPEMDG